MGTSIKLTAQPDSLFGVVGMYKWDNGITAGWDDSSKTLSQLTCTYQYRDTCEIRLKMRDTSGYEDSTTFTLRVTNDNPVITGIENTAISINDSITFNIKASDPEGIRLPYYWDFNSDGIYEDSTTQPTIAHLFSETPETISVTAAVRDCFDGFGTASANISVVLDAPVASASSDRLFAYANQAIHFTGTASDEYGSIVEYAWDFNNDGIFEYSSTLPIEVDTAFTDMGLYPVVLRVKDDDNNYGYDTLAIRIGSTVTDSNTVAYWDFNEGSGNMLYDLSGNGNNGTIYGATWTDGKIDNALSFDGVDDYVKVPRSSSLEPVQAITIECWVYAEVQNTNIQYIRLIRKEAHMQSGYSLSWKQNEDQIQLRLNNFENGYKYLYVTNPNSNSENIRQWIYIAATYQQGDSAKLYINGKLVKSEFATDFQLWHTDDLYIGGYFSNMTGFETFTGNIDEIRVSDKVRTPSEIESYWLSNK
uniref:PKD domain-containing protein n=1 Tax=uncultured microorganism TaxID=358574 RepID=F8UGX2_9ZZZZ|nr:conserved hypothetical protein [uncultured microorganism]